MDTFVGNAITANGIAQSGCLFPQILIIHPDVEGTHFNSLASMQLMNFLSPSQPGCISKVKKLAEREPVCFSELWAGIGCKFHYSSCINGKDVHMMRDYALQVYQERTQKKLEPSRTKCKAYLALREDTRILAQPKVIEDLIKTHTSCELESIYWERYSTEEQIAKVATGHLIIGVASSSTHNFVWCVEAERRR